MGGHAADGWRELGRCSSVIMLHNDFHFRSYLLTLLLIISLKKTRQARSAKHCGIANKQTTRAGERRINPRTQLSTFISFNYNKELNWL